jgi:hypothetical protein
MRGEYVADYLREDFCLGGHFNASTSSSFIGTDLRGLVFAVLAAGFGAATRRAFFSTAIFDWLVSRFTSSASVDTSPYPFLSFYFVWT